MIRIKAVQTKAVQTVNWTKIVLVLLVFIDKEGKSSVYFDEMELN